MIALFFELPRQFDIAQVHLVLLSNMFIAIFLLGLEVVEGVVVELVLVLIVVHGLSYILYSNDINLYAFDCKGKSNY